MAVRLPTACLVLAALFGAGWCLSATAKPPDLPVKEQIVCEPPAVPGADAPVGDDLHARARQITGMRTLQRCLIFAANPLLALLPLEDWVAEEEDTPASLAAAEEQERPAEEPFACPYLRGKAAREQTPSPTPPAPGTVAENLAKLEHAARVYERAESYRRRGRLEEARGCYESVCDLCPGSRFARMASERLEHLSTAATKPAEEEAGEEEDAPPPPPEEKKGENHSALQTTGSRVAALLERCQRAFAAERYDEAERLARRAVALDPGAVAAHPLVYKLQLLAQLRERIQQLPRHPYLLSADDSEGPGLNNADRVIELMHRYYDFFKQSMYSEAELCALQALALDPGNPTVLAAARLAGMEHLLQLSSSQPAVCPWAAEPRTTMRQPDLPPVDPKVVGAMEKILTEVGEPGAETATITVEEQGAAEEQDEPPASPEEVPTLLLDPPVADTAEHSPCSPILLDLADRLRSAACVEVDSQPLGGRGQCQVPLGMISARVAWDWRGEHGSFLLALGIGETADLRAEQWERNDQVADWITRHSGGAEGAPDGGQP